ncbi:MAG: hypothetical protein NWF01_07285 [Candidatus Bathyarchaeota archaeon]|nr:hypothetical protein [Candidatus Bathyarchaeota archaeon]
MIQTVGILASLLAAISFYYIAKLEDTITKIFEKIDDQIVYSNNFKSDVKNCSSIAKNFFEKANDFFQKVPNFCPKEKQSLENMIFNIKEQIKTIDNKCEDLLKVLQAARNKTINISSYINKNIVSLLLLSISTFFISILLCILSYVSYSAMLLFISITFVLTGMLFILVTLGFLHLMFQKLRDVNIKGCECMSDCKAVSISIENLKKSMNSVSQLEEQLASTLKEIKN